MKTVSIFQISSATALGPRRCFPLTGSCFHVPIILLAVSGAVNLFQVVPAQNEELKKRFASITGEDYDVWFGSQGFDVQQAMGEMEGSTPDQGGLNSQSMTPPAMQAQGAAADSGL